MGVCAISAIGNVLFASSEVKSPVTSPVTSPTLGATLAGYVVTDSYNDTSCKTLLRTSFEELNKCQRTDSNSYKYITATSSSLRTVYYMDPLCTLAYNGSNAKPISYTEGVCDKFKRKTSISSTSTFTKDVATVIQK